MKDLDILGHQTFCRVPKPQNARATTCALLLPPVPEQPFDFFDSFFLCFKPPVALDFYKVSSHWHEILEEVDIVALPAVSWIQISGAIVPDGSIFFFRGRILIVDTEILFVSVSFHCEFEGVLVDLLNFWFNSFSVNVRHNFFKTGAIH